MIFNSDYFVTMMSAVSETRIFHCCSWNSHSYLCIGRCPQNYLSYSNFLHFLLDSVHSVVHCSSGNLLHRHLLDLQGVGHCSSGRCHHRRPLHHLQLFDHCLIVIEALCAGQLAGPLREAFKKNWQQFPNWFDPHPPPERWDSPKPKKGKLTLMFICTLGYSKQIIFS